MNVEIAERLASRRRDAGFSQEALAEKLGVTRQAVSKWERSESSPDTDNLIALARLYGVSLDELLNVNPALEDDIAFEAADRAAAHRASEREDGASGSDATSGSAAGNDVAGSNAPSGDMAEHFDNTQHSDSTAPDDAPYSNFFAPDEKTRVHIDWRDGVHVKDAQSGDEVHVGWKGINIRSAGDEECFANSAWSDNHENEPWHLFSSSDMTPINVDGAQVYYKRFHPWHKFPFFLLVLIAYILMGFELIGPGPLYTGTGVGISPWAYGAFLFTLIPVYHMVVHALSHRGLIRFIQGFYPYASVVWFLWMWLIIGHPHPAWVIFLTIPIVEWACETIRHRLQRRRARTQEAAE